MSVAKCSFAWRFRLCRPMRGWQPLGWSTLRADQPKLCVQPHLFPGNRNSLCRFS